MSQHPGPWSGQCLCGGIHYQVEAIRPQMAHCHCSMCRKFHGAAFATFGVAKKEDFNWLSGKELLASYRAENGTVRQFCKNCGSSMTFASSGCTGEVVEFALGTLDNPLNMQPDSHIYTQSKADWYEIEDTLPRFAEGREQG